MLAQQPNEVGWPESWLLAWGRHINVMVKWEFEQGLLGSGLRIFPLLHSGYLWMWISLAWT